MGEGAPSVVGDRVLSGGHTGIGYGRFADLSVTDAARLLAYMRIKADPDGQHRKLSPAEGLKRLRSAAR